MIQVSKELILSFFKEHKQEFEQNYGVKTIGVFGSIVRDELREDSDIDIAIEMVPAKKNLRNFIAFQQLLEKEFGRRIDLGIESSLKDFVKRRIDKEIIYV